MGLLCRQVIKDARAFAALKEEWEDLYRNSLRTTPFQSWDWLHSWWEYYGKGYELRLVTLRDNEGLLVGLVPLVLERWRGFRRLLFMGTGLTDYLDILAREGWENRVAETGTQALKQLQCWQVADLQRLRPEAAAWDLLQRWEGLRIRVPQAGCPIIDVKPWDELVADLSKNHRSTIRRTLRRADKDGVRRELVKPEDAKRAARRWVALHREAWQGREILPEHSTQRWASFAETVASRMITTRGLGEISEFWLEGEAIVSTFWLYGCDSVGYYLHGASQKAIQRYQISSLLMWDGVTLALERHSTYLDMLRGEEPYKLRWSSNVLPNFRVVLGRNPVVSRLYAGYVILRSRTQQYVDADSTPQWVRGAAHRLQKATGL